MLPDNRRLLANRYLIASELPRCESRAGYPVNFAIRTTARCHVMPRMAPYPPPPRRKAAAHAQLAPEKPSPKA